MGQMSKVRFHFELFWPKFDDYLEVVANAWQRPTGQQDPLSVLDSMFRALVRELQRWSATKIGGIKDQLLMARELVLRLDRAQERRQLSEEELGLWRRMKMCCLGLASLERTMARQRSRVRQLREGDANTAYFHLIARGRKRRSFIRSLTVDGHIIAEQDAMHHVLHEHFSAVFGTAASGGTTLNFLALGIQPLDLSEQEAAITPEEVWATIKAMPSDRAPGPDGFTGAFYKSSWGTISNEVMAAVVAFAQGNIRSMDKLNNALVVLLPKKVGANCPADFRPITIIHSFAKLISKLLALRLAPRLHELIASNQNAFIRTRSIHDNYKYIQRAAVLIRKKRVPMLLLILDISKAFDTLSWPFLLDTLQAWGFGETWLRWIETLLSTATSRIILNGQKGPPIRHLRGVRQGDSLSPMFFIIAMDVLHRLFQKAATDGVLRRMEPSQVKFQCSLYADDVILFIRPHVQEARAVKQILHIFGEASGLQTNLAKCSVTPIFGGEESLDEIVSILGCQV
jgi:hypothetical protein